MQRAAHERLYCRPCSHVMHACMVTKRLCKNFCPAAIYACRPCPHARMLTKGVHIVSALQHMFCCSAMHCMGIPHSAATEKTTSKDNVRSRMITFRYDGKNDIKRQRPLSDDHIPLRRKKRHQKTTSVLGCQIYASPCNFII